MNKNYTVIDRMLNGQTEIVENSIIVDCDSDKHQLQDIEMISADNHGTITFGETNQSTCLPLISFGRVNTCHLLKK